MSAKIELINGDCMKYMAKMPDKAFDLAIVDPPYFVEFGKESFYKNKSGLSSAGIRQRHKECKFWEIPDQNYFNAVKRVSVNQILWGANYFYMKGTQGGAIIWDKKAEGVPFSEAEIAYCSLHKKVVMYRQLWMGCMREKDKRSGIHPCEKPISLYKWLLKNYAKPGDKILDTHLGSGSIAIACHDMGFDLVGYEIDKDYYDAAVKRLDNHRKQLTIEF